MAKTRQEVLRGIEERMKSTDFLGTILDDIWAEQVTPRAMEFLSVEEVEGLEGDSVAEGVNIVLRHFVRYIMGIEGVKSIANDIEEVS